MICFFWFVETYAQQPNLNSGVLHLHPTAGTWNHPTKLPKWISIFLGGFRLLVSFRGLVKKMCHWPMMRLQKKQFAKTNVHKMVMQWWWNPKVRKKITFLQIQDHHTAVSLAHSVHPTSCNCNQSYRASWLEFLPLQLVATEWHRAICSGAHKRW